MYKNFLAIDIEKDFLQRYSRRATVRDVKNGVWFRRLTGVGMLLNAAVLFAYQSQDPRLVAKRGDREPTAQDPGFGRVYRRLCEGVR